MRFLVFLLRLSFGGVVLLSVPCYRCPGFGILFSFLWMSSFCGWATFLFATFLILHIFLPASLVRSGWICTFWISFVRLSLSFLYFLWLLLYLNWIIRSLPSLHRVIIPWVSCYFLWFLFDLLRFGWLFCWFILVACILLFGLFFFLAFRFSVHRLIPGRVTFIASFRDLWMMTMLPFAFRFFLRKGFLRFQFRLGVLLCWHYIGQFYHFQPFRLIYSLQMLCSI